MGNKALQSSWVQRLRPVGHVFKNSKEIDATNNARSCSTGSKGVDDSDREQKSDKKNNSNATTTSNASEDKVSLQSLEDSKCQIYPRMLPRVDSVFLQKDSQNSSSSSSNMELATATESRVVARFGPFQVKSRTLNSSAVPDKKDLPPGRLGKIVDAKIKQEFGPGNKWGSIPKPVIGSRKFDSQELKHDLQVGTSFDCYNISSSDLKIREKNAGKSQLQGSTNTLSSSEDDNNNERIAMDSRRPTHIRDGNDADGFSLGFPWRGNSATQFKNEQFGSADRAFPSYKQPSFAPYVGKHENNNARDFKAPHYATPSRGKSCFDAVMRSPSLVEFNSDMTIKLANNSKRAVHTLNIPAASEASDFACYKRSKVDTNSKFINPHAHYSHSSYCPTTDNKDFSSKAHNRDKGFLESSIHRQSGVGVQNSYTERLLKGKSQFGNTGKEADLYNHRKRDSLSANPKVKYTGTFTSFFQAVAPKLLKRDLCSSFKEPKRICGEGLDRKGKSLEDDSSALQQSFVPRHLKRNVFSSSEETFISSQGMEKSNIGKHISEGEAVFHKFLLSSNRRESESAYHPHDSRLSPNDENHNPRKRIVFAQNENPSMSTDDALDVKVESRNHLPQMWVQRWTHSNEQEKLLTQPEIADNFNRKTDFKLVGNPKSSQERRNESMLNAKVLDNSNLEYFSSKNNSKQRNQYFPFSTSASAIIGATTTKNTCNTKSC